MIRQEWPETISAQEVFDHVIEHLREWDGQACDINGRCMYRRKGPGNPACAAGCLLTDDEAELTRNNSWGVVHNDERDPKRLRPHADMILDLQRLHDRSTVGYPFDVENISEIAGRYGLAYKKPEGALW